MDTADLPAGALQDILSAQHIVLLGLIANFTGSALQDDIAITVRRLLQLGQDVLNNSTHSKEDNMVSKQPIFPEGVRQVPKQFSWLDHRLIRDHHIEQCSHPAAALYLFLVTVGDARG